jgi:DNA polymerase (family 10)
MPVHNADIARAFEEIADLLEIRDANPFRVRAYRNAARTVGNRSLDLAAAVREGRPLPKLPGIGADLSGKIADLARTGSTPLLEQLRRKLPPGIGELLRLPGLGPVRVRRLYRELGVGSLSDLERAARAGSVRRLAGFGERMEATLLQAVQAQPSKASRFPLAAARREAEALIAELRQARGVGEVIAAGSLRRGRDTVGDIDLLATAADSRDVMRRFADYAGAARLLSRGPTRSSIVLKSGIQADLRVVPARSYGAALVYFTGSRAHNIALRRLAQAQGLKINEYGVYRGKRRIAGETEASVYSALGLRTIAPEQRENQGEIEAARGEAAASATRRPPR